MKKITRTSIFWISGSIIVFLAKKDQNAKSLSIVALMIFLIMFIMTYKKEQNTEV